MHGVGRVVVVMLYDLPIKGPDEGLSNLPFPHVAFRCDDPITVMTMTSDSVMPASQAMSDVLVLYKDDLRGI